MLVRLKLDVNMKNEDNYEQQEQLFTFLDSENTASPESTLFSPKEIPILVANSAIRQT